ncbi:class 3 lipase [Chloropicon roscoffensis]|uniref:Class 3 lipase n=1 Tax=Chloropicon roscoffensis TaxID=1461544 RepID=A0AAX4PCI4_9CHLO
MAGTLRRLLFGDAESRDIAESLRERRRSGHLARCLKVEEHPGDLAHKVLCSMVLSEAVYKQSDEEVERFIQLTNGLLPWSLPRNKLNSLQFSCEWAMQRCLVTESGGGLFVCFRGTKVQRDFLTDLNVFFDPVFDSYHEEGEDANTPKFVSKSETPCAHRGFLFRAKAVPILWFYRVAKRRGLKLVFTGHSLGGAVASLATIRLLHWLEGEGKTWHQTNVSCVSFAAPAVGNLALQKYVSSRGWDALLYNYTLKEDFVPILMQPQKLLRWKTTKAAKPSAAAEEAGSGPSASASGSSGEEDGDGGGAAKQAEGSGRGYALQAIKFAVRLRRMVPIVNGSRSGSARGANANTFAYVGRQLTVLDDVVVPAALKNETLREYKELSTDSPEGPARDAESSKRWNLVRWAVQSFEAHRMYSYRDRILAACKIFPKVPDSSQRVALGNGVLPEVELNFGTARLCKPLDTSRRGASSASVHITLAGRNLLSCKDFQVEIQGQLMKVEKFFSSKLCSKRASMWSKMRLQPEDRLSFWEKAFSDSEEVLHLQLKVPLTQQLKWEDVVTRPIRAVCRSDFQTASSSLVVVPVHVRLTGWKLGYTQILHGLLQRHGASEGEQGTIDYSVLSTMDLLRARIAMGPQVTVEETSDIMIFVDTLDRWQGRHQPPVPYGVKRAFLHGVESYLVLLHHQPFLKNLRESLSFTPPSSAKAVGEGAGSGSVRVEISDEFGDGDVEAKVKRAGFTGVLLDEDASRAILHASPELLSPFALYNFIARRGHGALVDELSANRKVMEQVRAIHETVSFGASNNQMPSPLLHRRTMK